MSGTLQVGGVTLATHTESPSTLTLDSGVVFPAIGQLAFWHGYSAPSSSITFTLDGISSYTVLFTGRHASSPLFPKNLSFIINSSNGTITNKTDAWHNSLNESYNTSTNVLTLTGDSSTEVMHILIFRGAITEGT